MTWSSDRRYYDDMDRQQRDDWHRQSLENTRRSLEGDGHSGTRRRSGPSEPMPIARIAVGLFLCAACLSAAFDEREQGAPFVAFAVLLSLAPLLLVRSGIRLLRLQTEEGAPRLPWRARAFWGALLAAVFSFRSIASLGGGERDRREDAAAAAVFAGLGVLFLISGLVRRRRWRKDASA